MKKVSVDGKVALVTGANRGIGKAIAMALLESGASKVYAGARDIDSLSELQNEYGERLVPVQLDVTDDASVAAAAEQATDVEILVNNAGVFALGSFADGNMVENYHANMDVNALGVVRVTQAFFEVLRTKESGAVVNVASVAGLTNMAIGINYSASKAFAHSVTQGTRSALKDTGILVSGVYPGPVDTDMTKDFPFAKATPESVAARVIAGIENGDEEIFPDAMAEDVGNLYFEDPKELERQYS